MKVGEETLVDKEVMIAAPQEQVFQFLIDSEKMSRWMGQNVALDPKPGGQYRIDLNGRNIMVGEFVEVEEPSRVVMTFGWEGDDAVPPGSTRVEFHLMSEGEATTLRLLHYGLSAERAESHTEGWLHYMERLAVAAVGADPGPDPYAEVDEMEE